MRKYKNIQLFMRHYIFSNLKFVHYIQQVIFKLIPKEFYTTKMWLETKGVPDHKQYMLILLLSGKEDLHQWESFPLATPKNTDKKQPDYI